MAHDYTTATRRPGILLAPLLALPLMALWMTIGRAQLPPDCTESTLELCLYESDINTTAAFVDATLTDPDQNSNARGPIRRTVGGAGGVA